MSEVKVEYEEGKYAGSYAVRELTGLDIMDISSETIRRSEEGTPDQTLWNNLLILKSVRRLGDEVKKELCLEDLQRMPAKLYQSLSMATLSLNTLSQEEQRFLLRRS